MYMYSTTLLIWHLSVLYTHQGVHYKIVVPELQLMYCMRSVGQYTVGGYNMMWVGGFMCKCYY